MIDLYSSIMLAVCRGSRRRRVWVRSCALSILSLLKKKKKKLPAF
jgi:hypothetical protein